MQRQAWLGQGAGFPASGAPRGSWEGLPPRQEGPAAPTPARCCVVAAWLGDPSGGIPPVSDCAPCAGPTGSGLCSLIRGPPEGALPKASCGSGAGHGPE